MTTTKPDRKPDLKPNDMPDARKDEHSPWPGWKPGAGDSGPSRGRSERKDRPDRLGEGGDLTAHDQLKDLPKDDGND